MALPNPTLTWVQSSLQAIAGGSSPTNQQVLDALSTLLGSSTYWEVKSSGSVYLEIGPKAGSAISSFKALVCDNPTAGYGTNAASAAGIWVGFAPDGGTYANYKTATPWGAARFSKYWMGIHSSNGDEMWIVESDEQLWVYVRDGTSYWGFGIGALFEGADASSIESDDRIYGMIVNGSDVMASSFLNTPSDYLGHDTSNNCEHVGFMKPGENLFYSLEKIQTALLTDSSASMVSKGGSLISVPLHYRTDSDGGYYVGRLRQIRATCEFSNRTTITDNVPTVQGYIFSTYTSPSVGDSIIYCNS